MVVQELGLGEKPDFNEWIMTHVSVQSDAIRASNLFKEIVEEGSHRALALYRIIGSSIAFSETQRSKVMSSGQPKSTLRPTIYDGYNHRASATGTAHFNVASTAPPRGYSAEDAHEGLNQNNGEQVGVAMDSDVTRSSKPSKKPTEERSLGASSYVTTSSRPSKNSDGHTPAIPQSNMVHPSPVAPQTIEKSSDTVHNTTLSAVAHPSQLAPQQTFERSSITVGNTTLTTMFSKSTEEP